VGAGRRAREVLTVDDDRFWELVGLLGGTADDSTTPRLAAVLAEHDEADTFGDHLDVLVAQLLASCDVPPAQDGDTAEWIAAAIIARGRETYRRTLAAGGVLDPDAWEWAEAESLLLVGMSGEDEEPADAFGAGLTLQWKSAEVPVGVETGWDPESDQGDDDPAHGRVPTSDEAWDAALGVLATDEEFQRRRAALEPIALHVVVRDIEELELSAWPDPDAVESVVLAVPTSLVLAEESRVEAYLDAVVTIMTAVQEALGDPS
jgi:hypothetical protein